ncbi:MAG: hypothetical protein AAGI46_03340 [Planctomycetota bacterium]
MDPVTLATLTAAAAVLGTKVVEGVASEAGKSLWGKIKEVLCWKDDPSEADLPAKLAEGFANDERLAADVLALLREDPDAQSSGATQLVGSIKAKKVFVVGTNHGGINA